MINHRQHNYNRTIKRLTPDSTIITEHLKDLPQTTQL